MANNLLTNEERMSLIDEYKKVKLNAPPPNIKDATLIENFGTNEQKAKLQSAAQAQKAAKTESAGSENPAGTNDTAGNKPAAEQSTEQPNAGNSQAPEAVNTVNTPNPAVENPEAAAAAKVQAEKGAKYVEAFDQYVTLFGKMPKDSLTTDELHVKIAAKQETVRKANEAAAAREAENAGKKATATKAAAAQKVTIINKVTKEETVIPLFTWERFVSKDKTHDLKVTPAELN